MRHTAACSWLMAILAAVTADSEAGLREQLSAYAEQQGFAVEGLDRVQGESQSPMLDDARETLFRWLAAYNYLIVEGKGGRIERVVITGPKHTRPRRVVSPAVQTIREGAHHRVTARLIGPNGVPHETSLIVDTGASSIVLPESLAGELGFALPELSPGLSQTANGSVPVRTGLLKSVAVGAASAPDVQVVFVADRRLGAGMLLGMSFLGRFRFTLDDDHDELILMSK